MLLLRLWNYLRGYVIILVEGYFLEKFINICIRRQIFLWDLKRSKNSTMTLKISIKGFKSLRPIARKTSCRVHIVAKKGVPFVLYRYRKRKAFAVGAFLFIAMMYVLSSFVWVIEVNGNQRIDDSILLRDLKEMGVRTGALKYGIDTDWIVNNLMLKNSDLSWVEVEVKGTKVKVEVSERILRPEMVPLEKPCDIIAERDGLIKNVIAKEGQEVVKAGDTVIKGQLLISGTIVAGNQEKTTELVHAIGEVYARTWYEDTAPVNLVIEEKKLTGRTKKNIAFTLFSKKIKLPVRNVNFENYHIKHYENNLRLGKDLVFPFGIIIDTYSEYKIVKKKLTEDEAKELTMNLLYEKVRSSLPEDAEVVDIKKDFFNDEKGILHARIIIECIEDIGIKREIGGN